MSPWPPLEVDAETVDELQRGLDQLIRLGAEIAVVRADGGELLAAAERHGWQARRNQDDGFVHAFCLWEGTALGVFTRKDLGAIEVERIVERLRRALRWG